MGVILSLFHTVRNRTTKQRTAAPQETHELSTFTTPPGTSSAPTATIPRPRLPPRIFGALSRTQTPASPGPRAGPPVQALPAAISPQQQPRKQQKRGMADDASYLSFLEKANAPLGGESGEGARTTGKKGGFKTVDEGATVPAGIREAIGGVVYVSEADEGFEGVSLGTGGRGLVDGGMSSFSLFFSSIPCLRCWLLSLGFHSSPFSLGVVTTAQMKSTRC